MQSGFRKNRYVNSCVYNEALSPPAAQIIAWLRICRPGSVIGPQQIYLEEIQERMYREGDAYHNRNQESESSMRTGTNLRNSNASSSLSVMTQNDIKNLPNNANTKDIVRNINKTVQLQKVQPNSSSSEKFRNFGSTTGSSKSSKKQEDNKAAKLYEQVLAEQTKVGPKGLTQGDRLRAVKSMQQKTTPKNTPENSRKLNIEDRTVSQQLDEGDDFNRNSYSMITRSRSKQEINSSSSQDSSKGTKRQRSTKTRPITSNLSNPRHSSHNSLHPTESSSQLSSDRPRSTSMEQYNKSTLPFDSNVQRPNSTQPPNTTKPKVISGLRNYNEKIDKNLATTFKTIPHTPTKNYDLRGSGTVSTGRTPRIASEMARMRIAENYNNPSANKNSSSSYSKKY